MEQCIHCGNLFHPNNRDDMNGCLVANHCEDDSSKCIICDDKTPSDLTINFNALDKMIEAQNTYKAGCWIPQYQYSNWRELSCDLEMVDTATSLEEAKRVAMEMAEESGAIMADVREYIPTRIGGMEGHSFELHTNKRDSRNHAFSGWTN